MTVPIFKVYSTCHRRINICYLLIRLILNIAEDHSPENQCLFRADTSTKDMLFLLKKKKNSENKTKAYMIFVDLN